MMISLIIQGIFCFLSKSFSCFVQLLTKFIVVDCSRSSDPYKYNMLPPLPAQRNLTPPPTLYPQQPVSVSESYSYPRFSLSGSSEMSASSRTKRSDINVWRSLYFGNWLLLLHWYVFLHGAKLCLFWFFDPLVTCPLIHSFFRGFLSAEKVLHVQSLGRI